MFRSWKLGSPFGIGVYVHWSFLLLLGFVFFSDWAPGQAGMAALEALLVLAVFGCIVLHELGHALMARYYGIATRDITLYPIGGVARLERLSERPVEEFWIALAGPAVNAAIAFVLSGILFSQGAWRAPGESFAEWLEGSFLTALLLSNVMLLAFNLLPVFPSDGGRILRALLAVRLGRLRATRIAAGTGAGMALFLCLAGAFPQHFLAPFLPGHLEQSEPMYMLMLVAVFLYFAGRQELRAMEYREAARERPPLDMQPIPSPLSNALVVGAGFSGFTWDSRTRLWIQWQNGQPIHTISVE